MVTLDTISYYQAYFYECNTNVARTAHLCGEKGGLNSLMPGYYTEILPKIMGQEE